MTVLELLVVLVILAMAAALAAPLADPISPASTQTAAHEVARACRFAQREAMRTGAWHTVGFEPAAQAMRVYRLDAAGLEDSSQPPVDPFEKRAYRIGFGGGALAAKLVAATFRYDNGTVAPRISFAPDGAPAIPGATGAVPLKNDGQVVLRHGRVDLQVNVDAGTGRVWW